jgi:hypothetical protein
MKRGGGAWGASERQRPSGSAGPNASDPRRLRPSQILLFALLHYLLLLALAGLIFLIIHMPPKAVNLDGLILFFAQTEAVLTAPRRFFLWLWPGETTSRFLIFSTTVLNSLVWGLALASLRAFWAKVRE